jgi:hypothetical protein
MQGGASKVTPSTNTKQSASSTADQPIGPAPSRKQGKSRSGPTATSSSKPEKPAQPLPSIASKKSKPVEKADASNSATATSKTNKAPAKRPPRGRAPQDQAAGSKATPAAASVPGSKKASLDPAPPERSNVPKEAVETTEAGSITKDGARRRINPNRLLNAALGGSKRPGKPLPKDAKT